MGYFSCNSESVIATCDSYNWELLNRKTSRGNESEKRPFQITEFEFSDLTSATKGFSSTNLLGKGSHGSVYKARLHQIKLVAAVKTTRRADATVDNELEILSNIYHPRMVNLLGFASDPKQRKLIVVEYMPNGSLYDLLHSSGKPPGWIKRSRFALQIARAVQFLHSCNPPIIHRDIKSSNILIDSKFNSRISDFSLAIRGYIDDHKVNSTPPAGTLGYLDPGYLSPSDLSAKSDVFSFGILMLEIISGRNAIDIHYSPQSVVDWAVPLIKSGRYAEICDPRIGAPEDMEALRHMAVLSTRCVRSTVGKRPDMAEVVECLEGVYRTMKMQYKMCVGLGPCITDDSSTIKHEPLDESVQQKPRSTRRMDVAKYEPLDVEPSRRDGEYSGAAGDDVGGYLVRRSKSVGTTVEIKYQALDTNRRVGLSATRLGRSRSTGHVLTRKLANNNGATGRKWEYSKLLARIQENEEKLGTHKF